MEAPLPLFTLLSQALVAFTIEFDNEFERQMPHRTTDFGSTGPPNSPWLVSMVMWTRFLQFIPDAGIPIRELQPLVGMPKKELDGGLKRLADWWGYLILDRGGPDRGITVRFSHGGRQARAIFQSLTPAIEARWRERFGTDAIDAIRAGLAVIANHPDVAVLPDSLPILGYGLITRAPDGPRVGPPPLDPSLPALLSRPLLAFALEFERDSDLSLAICANVLRPLGEGPVPVRDLPGLSGVSKESLAVAMKFLEKLACVKIEPEARGSRFKAIALTPRGRKALERYQQLVRTIDDAWQRRFGADTIRVLRDRLARLDLSRGLEPPPSGWRAKVPKLDTLPHFPMILHRGGYPDGSGTWARRYDRLHLHTVRQLSGLAHFPIPRRYPTYLSRSDMVSYLDEYARHFGLRIVTGVTVRAIRPAADGWTIETAAGEPWQARVVVIATGQYREAMVPAWPGREEYGGRFVHSSAYVNAEPYAGQRVLVVGAGNSGAEIAADLAGHGVGFVALSIRTPPPIVPRDPFGMPVQRTSLLLSALPAAIANRLGWATARIALGDLTRYGLPRGRFAPYSTCRVPLIDHGFVDAVKRRRIVIRPALERLTATGAVFADGCSEPFDAIVAATGFRTGLETLIDAPGLLNDDHEPRAASGEPTSCPGLFFIGFTHSLRGHLFEANRASRRLARHIARQARLAESVARSRSRTA